MTCYTNDNRPDTWENLPPAGSLDDLPGYPAVPESGLFDPAVTTQATDAQGRYGWDVAGGCWYVVIEADGYTTRVSPAVGVPPEVTNLDLTLDLILGPQYGPRLFLPFMGSQ
jgi:hypothetical protein